VLPLDGTRRDWGRKVPEDAQRVIVDAAAARTATNSRISSTSPMRWSSGHGLGHRHGSHRPLPQHAAQHPRDPQGQVAGRAWSATACAHGPPPRSRAWTRCKPWPYPLVAQLRDTQAYVLMAGLGRSLFDYQSQQIREHQADWAPLLKWLKRA
jgi:chromosome partitioning protein